jgi:hypothetical protein
MSFKSRIEYRWADGHFDRLAGRAAAGRDLIENVPTAAQQREIAALQ